MTVDHPPAWARRVLFDPVVCYVAIAAIVGGILCFVIPLWDGNDEGAHFIRAFQISQGTFVPQNAPTHTRAGTGACVPHWLAYDYMAHQFGFYMRGQGPAPNSTEPTTPTPTPTLATFAADFTAGLRPCGAAGSGHFFIDISTFSWYSPLTYLPAAGAILAGRAAGLGSEGLDRAARLAQLLAVLVLMTIAIRRAPWARWIFTIVATLPLALVVSSTVRPDAITTALSLVVVATALRVASQGGFTRRSFVDAIAWSVVLGLSKPTYWIVAAAFLTVLIGARRPVGSAEGRLSALRNRGWRAFVPVIVAGATSTLWQSAQRNRFICDVRFFGVEVDARESARRMLVRPDTFLWNTVLAVRDHFAAWLRELVQVDRYLTGGNWPFAVVVVLLITYLALALRPTPVAGDAGDTEIPLPRRGERALFAVLAVVIIGLLAAGFAIYCSNPGSLMSAFFTARFLLPMLVAALLAAAPGRRLGAVLLKQPIPPVLALGAFYACFLTVVMHTVQ